MQNPAPSYESISPRIPLDVLMPFREESNCSLSGFGVSPGIVEGPCTVIRDLQNFRKIPWGTIVVCEAALPAMMPFMPLMAGLVAERGGSMSIASGYAREHLIPAAFGVNGIMGVVQEGDLIRVDGSRGAVDIVG